MDTRERGRVLKLFISIKGKGKESREELIIDKDGIHEDKFYAKDENRSILITSNDSYKLAKESNIYPEYGSLGENILIDLNPYSLSSGDRILIGDIELEITQNCTICNSLSKIDSKLPSILKSDRGIFAKALNSGKIQKDDFVKIIRKNNEKNI